MFVKPKAQNSNPKFQGLDFGWLNIVMFGMVNCAIAQKNIIFVNVFIIFVLGEILRILLEHLVLCPQIKAIVNIEIVEESNNFICVNMQTLVLHFTTTRRQD